MFMRCKEARKVFRSPLLAFGLLPGLAWCQQPPTLPRGHVFFETDFESAGALRGWTRHGASR